MSNDIYDGARYRFATAQLNWPTAKLSLIAFAGPPTFVASDVRVADIISRGTTIAIGHSLAINHQSVSPQGYLQTDVVILPAIPPGLELTHLVMATYVNAWDDGVPLLYLDDVLNLPFEPNGLDIPVQPDWLQQRGWARV